MNNPPLISYIVPARNEEEFIGNCIASLKKQELEDNFEILVVDNASNDNTAMVATQLGARVIKEKTPGLSYTRSKGLNSANGEIIIFVDADTILPKNWSKTVVGYIKKSKNVVAVSCGFVFHDGRFYENLGCYFILLINPIYNITLQLFGKPNLLLGQSFAIKKSALVHAGGVNMDFPFYAEDIAMAKRLSSEGEVRYLYSILARSSARRFHKIGFFRTLYLYMTPMILLMLGKYDRAKNFASKHDYTK
ncbi:MAG TPA: glycosyltransferase [Candidatus Limnocylindrales bacterium]|nr:glycosyltransferase [Candidatus Limnocylindrales bacterium]